MINTGDTLFIHYNELPDRSLMNDILYMGWYGNGDFALKQFADSYAYSATVLFDRFVEMKGHFAELDFLGITIVFSYRHYCELIIKYFYVKYIAKVRSFTSFEEYKSNIEEFFSMNQHSISQTWSKTEPILRNLKKKIESEVSIDAISSYFSQMNQFDDSSMTMRYPIKKDMSPMIEGHVKINIVNLNEKMQELISSIEQLDMDIDNQITHLAPMEKMELCFQCIKSNEDKFDTFVSIARFQETFEDVNEEGFSIDQLINPSKEQRETIRQMNEFVESLGAPVFRILEAMYYIGSDIIHESLNLPKQKDAALYCIITAILFKIKECGRIDYEIDTPLTDDPKETHDFYYTKSADCLANFVSAVMDRLRPYLKCDTISE